MVHVVTSLPVVKYHPDDGRRPVTLEVMDPARSGNGPMGAVMHQASDLNTEKAKGQACKAETKQMVCQDDRYNAAGVAAKSEDDNDPVVDKRPLEQSCPGDVRLEICVCTCGVGDR